MSGGRARHGIAALVLALAATFAVCGPAAAHRLKLFVAVVDGEIGGRAFFIGGGRPEGATVVIRDGRGEAVYRGATDAEGAFHWRPSTPGDYSIAIDGGDGHFVEERLSAARFGAAGTAGTAVAATAEASRTVAAGVAAGAASGNDAAKGAAAGIDAVALQRLVESSVDRAVARQLAPLIEAQVAAEGRLRFNDVMGGLGMIAGLAGAWAWAAARRRRDGEGGR